MLQKITRPHLQNRISKVPFKNIPLTKADFDGSRWHEVIDTSPEKDCLTYDSRFFAKAKEAEVAGDATQEELFTLLGAISSFMLKSDSIENPFAPKAVWRNSRSAILEDIPDAHLEVLKNIAVTIKDYEMRARVADVLWVRKRDFQMAELAVEGYLRSSESFENPEHWPDAADRIERATRIAGSLGPKNKKFAEVFTHIEAVLDRNKPEESSFLSAKMMELLLEFGQGDPNKYTTLADKAAGQAEYESNWHKARSYWEIKARWCDREKDADAKRDALTKAAETYVKEAESAITRRGPGYLAAATHLEKAIEAHRRVSNNKTRVEELHRELLRYQADSVKELKSLSTTMNVSDEVREAIETTVAAIKGKSFHDALFELALLLKLPTVEKLKKQAEESAGKHPLQHLFAGFIVDRQGKVVGRRPSMLSNDPDEIKEALRAEMFSQAGFSDIIEVRWVFEPVIQQIVLEHPCRLDDFIALVSNHSLVPEGREILYAKGLRGRRER